MFEIREKKSTVLNCGAWFDFFLLKNHRSGFLEFEKLITIHKLVGIASPATGLSGFRISGVGFW